MSNPIIDELTPKLGTKKAATEALHDIGTAIKNALINHGEVRLPGVGTIVVTERAARTGRNPRTGEKVDIAAQKSAKLKVAAELKRALNGE